MRSISSANSAAIRLFCLLLFFLLLITAMHTSRAAGSEAPPAIIGKPLEVRDHQAGNSSTLGLHNKEASLVRTSQSSNGHYNYLPISASPYFGGTTTLVSRSTGGTQGNLYSIHPSISDDGRFVAFHSGANNLVDNDDNNSLDVFVHDRQLGETTLISRHSDGAHGNYESGYPSISGDGRFVAFASLADNLVDDDSNLNDDIFIHDRQTGETKLISRHSDGTQGQDNSPDFPPPSISANGRSVAYASKASNLVDNDTNDQSDVFVHDCNTGETVLISRHTDGTQGNGYSAFPSISADGSLIAFDSIATNLVDNDANDEKDVFVHDLQSGNTTLVSRATDGTPGDRESGLPALSAGGGFVAFSSYAANLVHNGNNGILDIYTHDLQTGVTTKVSLHTDGTAGNDRSEQASISTDGRFVTFTSESSNLVGGDNNGLADIFVHDRLTGTTKLISRHSSGAQGDGSSEESSISGQGRFVAFHSYAANLVDHDANGGETDIFVHDREP